MQVVITPIALTHSRYIAQTGLPDLTQPQYLDRIFGQLPIAVAIFAVLAIGLGAGMALINFSRQSYPHERNVVVGDWVVRADRLMRGLQQVVLVSVLMLAGFLFCSTLANRQNSWEQARLTQAAPTIAGEPIQQTSPQVSYTSQEPYVYTTTLNGKLVKVQDKKDVTRQTAVSGSNLQVRIDPTQRKPGEEANYLVDFRGDYQVTNPVGTTDRFVFKIDPPTNYSLLQNFSVDQDGKRLTAINPGEYRYPLQIAPGSVSKLRVSYRTQGSPQWVYSASTEFHQWHYADQSRYQRDSKNLYLGIQSKCLSPKTLRRSCCGRSCRPDDRNFTPITPPRTGNLSLVDVAVIFLHSDRFTQYCDRRIYVFCRDVCLDLLRATLRPIVRLGRYFPGVTRFNLGHRPEKLADLARGSHLHDRRCHRPSLWVLERLSRANAECSWLAIDPLVDCP
jgi:hypothetical protein